MNTLFYMCMLYALVLQTVLPSERERERGRVHLWRVLYMEKTGGEEEVGGGGGDVGIRMGKMRFSRGSCRPGEGGGMGWASVFVQKK
ncbi:hypothetical protein LX32DRAFT_340330 [Colletotrichum zoysiae]|uniref:Secreted protein n=1 Tax=Colletotrichum zoysiae TaxID=1216348 RepID=A0AAD9HVM6_9PEZI|nr:hypothetical protein LX32DRAFT_340330 [Colletotrichum zoysiae]